jgi:hypothetical protein
MTTPEPAAPLTEREARDAFLRAMQEAHLYARERQRVEDAADAMIRAARATSTPAGLDVPGLLREARDDVQRCRNCGHDHDRHDLRLNRGWCAGTDENDWCGCSGWGGNGPLLKRIDVALQGADR